MLFDLHSMVRPYLKTSVTTRVTKSRGCICEMKKSG
jgi:hypothetical protein